MKGGENKGRSKHLNQLTDGRARHRGDVASVLVEDEERIRRYWHEYFAENGMCLKAFASAEAFLAEFKPDGGPVQFYFDQDFGHERGVGVKLAKHVQDWPGRVSASLVTAYEPGDFVRELDAGVIDFVLPKYPEGIFPVDYQRTVVNREIERIGYAAFVEGELGKLEEALKPLVSTVQEDREPQSCPPASSAESASPMNGGRPKSADSLPSPAKRRTSFFTWFTKASTSMWARFSARFFRDLRIASEAPRRLPHHHGELTETELDYFGCRSLYAHPHWGIW